MIGAKQRVWWSVAASAAVASGVFAGHGVRAADLPPDQVGIVSHIKVVTDKVPDVSSIEAWKKSYIKEGMSDKDKALAVFNTMVAFQNADAGPKEYLGSEDVVLDAMKIINVYGHSFCSISSAHVATLARSAGLKARNLTIMNHVVPEIFYDKGWHMMDADLVEYFPKADGSIASIQEIVDGVSQWEKEHPDFPVELSKKQERYKYMKDPGWKTGPEILLRNPFYDERGWLPDHYFAWGDTMQQFSKISNNYESAYSVGYQVNIELRPGEKLLRNWSNKGLWSNQDTDKKEPESLNLRIGTGALKYSLQWGDLAPGRIGNGVLEYDVPLTNPTLGKTAITAENLAAKSPALQVADAAKPGVLEINMPTSYVYLSGTADFKAAVGPGGEIRVLLSSNNGLDWKDVDTVSSSGEQKVDLTKLVVRKYDYRLRFVMKGQGTGLESLKFTHDVEQSQRALPALDKGANSIHFSAGPNESTVTIEGAANVGVKGKALTYEDFHAALANCGPGRLAHSGGGESTIDFPITTPGDMKQLRIFAHYATGSPNGTVWNAAVSFDSGKTFKKLSTVDSVEGPRFGQLLVTDKDIPAGTRSAVVRYIGTGSDTSVVNNYRIDADYAQVAGGFRPVKVTYAWTEDGQDKSDVHVAAKADETYTIKCDSKPLMKSVTMELAE